MHRLVRAIAAACSMVALSCGAAPTAPTAAPTTVVSVPPSPAAPVGASTFTFSIDSACRAQFPQAAQQRAYPATFRSYAAPAGSGYADGVLALAGGVFRTDTDGAEWNAVYRSVATGSSMYSFDEPPIWEWLSPGEFLVFNGRSEYRSTSPYGEWSFSGSVFYCASTSTAPGMSLTCAVPEIICQSDHHRLLVTQVLPAAG